jgi:hypothetical protein
VQLAVVLPNALPACIPVYVQQTHMDAPVVQTSSAFAQPIGSFAHSVALPVYAVHASSACVWFSVPQGTQS